MSWDISTPTKIQPDQASMIPVFYRLLALNISVQTDDGLPLILVNNPETLLCVDISPVLLTADDVAYCCIGPTSHAVIHLCLQCVGLVEG